MKSAPSMASKAREDGHVSAAACAPTNAPPSRTQASSRRRGAAPSSPLVFRKTTALAPASRAAVSSSASRSTRVR